MTLKQIKKLRIEPDSLIAVVCEDLYQIVDWTPYEDIDKVKCPIVKAVGFFHKVSKNGLIVKNLIDEVEEDASFIAIPIGCIKRIRYLTLK